MWRLRLRYFSLICFIGLTLLCAEAAAGAEKLSNPSPTADETLTVPLEVFESEARRAGLRVGLQCEQVDLLLEEFRKANRNRLVPFAEWRFAILDSLYRQNVPYAVARGFLSELRTVTEGAIDTGFLSQLRRIDFGDRALQKIEPGVEPPRAIVHPLLPFTDAAREARVQGLIRIRCVVLEDGTVANCMVLRGLGYGMDEAAVLRIQNQWRFEPATRCGKPVPVEANIEIDMRLY